MAIPHTSVTIDFPENYGKEGVEFRENPGSIRRNNISFTWGKYGVRAGISPYYIPDEVSDHPCIQKEIVEPVIETVTAEIGTIKDFFWELRNLAAEGRIQANLFYRREVNGAFYRAYNYLRDEYLTPNPFKVLRSVKGKKKAAVPKKSHYLLKLAEFVGKEEAAIHHIEGRNAREAVKRLVTVYKSTDRISRLPLLRLK